jgi:hypothetical protein
MKQSMKLRMLAVGVAALGAAIGPAFAQTPQAPPAQVSAPNDPAKNTAARVATTKPAIYPGYVVPRLKDGKPDLSGVWTNATTTRLERARNYGDQLNFSDAEMATIEKDTRDRNARQNAPTPKEVQENWTNLAKGPDTLDECRSGSRGPACGYNAGWTDPGDWVMRVGGKGRTSMITYPVNGRMPARVPNANATGRARIVTTSEEDATRGAADNPEDRSLGERCIMSFGVSSGPVMTPQLYNNTYQFVQTKDHFVMWVEMVHDARIVPLNAKHRTEGLRPWMGDQIGWWEGDTLVVESIGFHPRQNVRGGSANMKLTERFTRVAEDRLHYAFDVQDPDTWIEPWGGEYEFAAVPDHVYEYACHEGNYGLAGILSGARADDEKAAAAKKKN